MSRIGKKPVEIPKGVNVTLDESNKVIKAKGPKGENELKYHKDINVIIEDNKIVVKRPTDSKNHKALHGLVRKLIDNLVVGVSKGFEKRLLIQGVGYKAVVKGNNLVLNVGFSHPVEMSLPDGISAKVENNIIILSGIDKQKLGQFAADIRSVRPPEPYKGAGIRYVDERIIRKAGKKAA